jgi:proliferating cell nuclear antigen
LALAYAQPAKKSKKDAGDDGEAVGVSIILEKQVSLTFSLKYLSNFAKSAPLSKEVSLNMSNDVPLLVQFTFPQGSLQFFLAPKVSSLNPSLREVQADSEDLG